MDRNREDALRRRIRSTRAHLLFLQHVATDPTSCDSEITRRYELIAAAKEAIRLHEQAITKIESLCEQAPSLVVETEARLRSLKKELNREKTLEQIKKLLIEHTRVIKELRHVSLDSGQG